MPIDRDTDAVWNELRERMPGLRPPSPANAVDRREVGALLTRIEAAVSRDVSRAFDWDGDGAARLITADRSYRAGRFATPSIGDLEARLGRRAEPAGAAALSFSV